MDMNGMDVPATNIGLVITFEDIDALFGKIVIRKGIVDGSVTGVIVTDKIYSLGHSDVLLFCFVDLMMNIGFYIANFPFFLVDISIEILIIKVNEVLANHNFSIR